MPVDHTHPQYDAAADAWQRIRDCVAGEDAIKAAGPRYLPKLGGQDDDDYAAYLKRGLYYNATGRTQIGLLGAMLRKPPKVVVPPGQEGVQACATLDGHTFETFARQVVEEDLTLGRYGVLVDCTTPAPGRAYLAGYPAEDVINWRTSVVDGTSTLSRVVLKECVEEEGPDEFEGVEVEQFRVLDLDEAGYYRQRVYRRVEQKDDRGVARTVFEQQGEDAYPTQRGVKLRFIPFLFFGTADLSPAVEKSPLFDLANANLCHWRLDADEKHGLHFTALPTPWTAGAMAVDANGQQQPLKIGSGVAWQFQDPSGHADMLEFTGAGLGAIAGAKAAIESYLVHLGAQILQDQKAAAETAEAMRLRSAAESSVLSMIAATVSAGLTRVLGWLVAWEGGDAAAVEVKLNRDFVESKMSPDEIRSLIDGWQKGAITSKVLAHQFEQGELLPPDVDAEAYEAELEAADKAKPPPALPGMTPFPGATPEPERAGGPAIGSLARSTPHGPEADAR